MPYATLNGHQVYYEFGDQVERPVLVLFNGITMSTPAWTLLLPILQTQYRLLRFDFLGQGQSDRPAGEKYTLTEQADMAMQLIDHLGIERFYLVGLSYGGMVAQHFTRRFQARILKLILASTLAWSDEASQRISDSWIAAHKAGGLDLRETISIPWLFSSRFLAANSAMLEGLKQMAGMLDWNAVVRLINGVKEHDARNWLHTLTVPTLILVGNEDRLTPRYQAELIQERLLGAKLEVIPYAGHVLHIEAAEAFSHAISRFCRPG